MTKKNFLSILTVSKYIDYLSKGKIMLYKYLKENYIPGEPIFTGDIHITGMTEENLRYHLKNLLIAGLYADLSLEYTIFQKRTFLAN